MTIQVQIPDQQSTRWQQVSVTLIVEFELLDPTTWVAFRFLKGDCEIKKAAERLKLSIH